MFFLVFFVFFFASTGALPSRMIGGDSPKPGQFPFIVSYSAVLSDYDLQICIGTILNNQWATTSAHCFWPSTKAEHVYILDENGSKYNLTEIVPHPDFNLIESVWNDIALTKIDGSFQFTDFVQPLEFGDVGEGGTFVGWDFRLSNITFGVQFVDVLVLTESECFSMGTGSSYNEFTRGPGQMCAYSKSGGLGACYGGTGGPLIENNTLVGIVSYSLDENCLEHEYPDVFTKVGYYKEWIQATIGN